MSLKVTREGIHVPHNVGDRRLTYGWELAGIPERR